MGMIKGAGILFMPNVELKKSFVELEYKKEREH
jgi:hypothetical protein